MNNQQYKSRPPIIAVALMIKNEATGIQATLSSLLNSGIRDFFVLDTGSTDNTIELTKAFFKQHQINGHIKQEAFVDFATSRNRTLELAEHHFPDMPFLLMPDAEWHLHHADALHDFCEQERHRDTELYLVPIKMNEVDFTTARLFRTASRVRFKGVVHEVPDSVASVKIPGPVYFEVNPTQHGMEKSKQRWKQDLVLLSKAYDANPEDSRNTFYLAQTYECLDDIENAYRFYQYREKLSGWDEENFITLLRLGSLATRVKQPDPLYGWAKAMDYYLKAHASRPHRIEPLVEIADYYWPDNIPTCYLFIRNAYDKPYPEHDLLFIDKDAYQYRRYEIMSRCAWHVGEYAMGEKATLQALAARPDTEHLHNNLELYRQKLDAPVVSQDKDYHD